MPKPLPNTFVKYVVTVTSKHLFLAHFTSSHVCDRYDAMVLFGESDEDIGFGSHLIERCEDAGLKMFVPQRDLVAGTIEHETSSKIISERCRKVIAVFSPTFLESERNMFLTGTILLIEHFLSKLFEQTL